jgi:hypothetical protein
MPHPENSTTPNPLLKKGGGFMTSFRCGVKQVISATGNSGTQGGTAKGLFLARGLYGLFYHTVKTAPPPTPSLKKGGGFMNPFLRYVGH